MHPVQIISYILIIVNVVVSYRGFNSDSFSRDYMFRVDNILTGKQYYRLISYGFLHAGGWPHLIFNMLSLLMFGASVEGMLGPLNFMLVYFVSLVGGGLFTLYIHRNHGDYSMAGASGAVCGIIFAAVALFPNIRIFFMPGWLYATLFVLYTTYGMRAQLGNIGHEAHLGGALAGMILAVILQPRAITANYPVIISILISASLALFFMMRRPYMPLRRRASGKKDAGYQTMEDRYNADRSDRQQLVNEILEKVHRKGIGSLTRKEKEILDRYSRQV